MRIFHVATSDHWAQAQRTGTYATSTIGRTLEEEGFIHAAFEDQWRGVLQRYYSDVVAPLLLLEIEADLLTSRLVVEPPVPGGEELFPHLYGPLNVDAVVAVHDISGV